MTTLQRVDRPRVLAWTGSTFGIKAIHVHVLEARGGNMFVKSEESYDGARRSHLPRLAPTKARRRARQRPSPPEGRGRTQSHPTS